MLYLRRGGLGEEEQSPHLHTVGCYLVLNSHEYSESCEESKKVVRDEVGEGEQQKWAGYIHPASYNWETDLWFWATFCSSQVSVLPLWKPEK